VNFSLLLLYTVPHYITAQLRDARTVRKRWSNRLLSQKFWREISKNNWS